MTKLQEALESVFSERYYASPNRQEFFTPRVAVEYAVKAINPTAEETIIDPACGNGAFLIQALAHVVDNHPNAASPADRLHGIDIMKPLADATRQVLHYPDLGKPQVIQGNSLVPTTQRQFDVVLANPPFNSKNKIIDPLLLCEYQLGYRWTQAGDEWCKTQKTKPTPPQILFLELCVNLLKPNGRMCIVLPESVLANPTEQYVRYWLLLNTRIDAIWDCPMNLFKPYTSTKTCMLFLTKQKVQKQNMLMSVISKCGHDHRGNPIETEEGVLDQDFSVAYNDWCKLQTAKTDFKLSNQVVVTDIPTTA